MKLSRFLDLAIQSDDPNHYELNLQHFSATVWKDEDRWWCQYQEEGDDGDDSWYGSDVYGFETFEEAVFFLEP